jgi:uncharacterized repeat protein (TIGR01451 family)
MNSNLQSQSHHALRSFLSGMLAVLVVSSLLIFAVLPAAANIGPMPPNLGGIYKSASKLMLSAGQTMTYTIHLEAPFFTNSTTLSADVNDPLPEGLDYVDGTANQGGTYDPATRSLSWSKVQVVHGSPVNLTFDVEDTATVNHMTLAVNTAKINLNGLTLQRSAWVTLLPPAQPLPPMAPSFKTADPSVLGPGEKTTYAIHLIDSGDHDATVTVTDKVPAPLTYVTGSASSGGVYDDATKTITWTGVSVPAQSTAAGIIPPVLLTFDATAPAIEPAANHPTKVTNTAIINEGTTSITRSADVLLVAEHGSPLDGSFKTASKHFVKDGDKITYTIYLHNSSAAAVPASVSDALPVGVKYVDGSANAGGVYDATTHTLTWSGLSVVEDTPMSLTFDATISNPLASPVAFARITNTAQITSGSVTLKRSTDVFVVSKPGGDIIPPVVNSFVIGDSDVTTNPQVTLHIDASDNVAVTSMCLKEWVLFSAPMPHWQQVKNCDKWVPFQADYDWTLTSQSGTHFVEVWVADAALNHSHLTRKSIDFVSLVLPNSHIDQGGFIPYLVYYKAGVDVSATLNVLTGDAQLFVWHPWNMFAPDHTPATTGATQTISFTTKNAGVYMFLVRGKQASDFDLSITPGGGPTVVPATSFTPAGGISLGSAGAPSAVPDLTYNPILPQSGLDPLSVSQDPVGPFDYTYLPLILR